MPSSNSTSRRSPSLRSSAASVWGIACVGAGLGGAVFQFLSGRTVKSLSESLDYTTAYNYLFIGYGLLALIGVFIVLFVMGPLHKDEALHAYVASVEEENKNEQDGNKKLMS